MLKTVNEISIHVKKLEEHFSNLNSITPSKSTESQNTASVLIITFSRDSTDEEEREGKDQPNHKDITPSRLVDKMPTILLIVIILCVKELVLFLISYLDNPRYIPT